MQARAGHFAHRIKPRNVRLAIHIRHHAAALVMRRRDDGDRLFGDVNAIAKARLINVGEAVNDEPRRLVRDVEQHAIRAGFLHLTVNGAGDDVARRKRFQRMIAVHELPAVK